MNALYLLLVAAGLAVTCWGLPASHRWRSPLNILPALAALVGVVAALLGVLLTAVPSFFKG